MSQVDGAGEPQCRESEIREQLPGAAGRGWGRTHGKQVLDAERAASPSRRRGAATEFLTRGTSRVIDSNVPVQVAEVPPGR